MSEEIKLMWRTDWRVSTKPVKVLDYGDGWIHVVGSLFSRQKRDQPDQSYHETQKEAVERFLSNAQRDVDDAERELRKAKNRLKSAHAKWDNFLTPKV